MMRIPASPWDAINLPELSGLLLECLRSECACVHAITKAAAQTFTANLLAAGDIPSLTVAPEEVPSFASHSAARLVNLGTLDISRRAAIPQAIATSSALFMAVDPQAEARPLRQIVDQALTSRSVQA